MAHCEAVTLRQLRALKAIADHGTISAAAAATHLSPAAVHAQLKALESNFGARLVERGPAGTSGLTAAGQTALEASQTIAQVIQRCADQVAALERGLSGIVVLGVVSTGKYFAPALVAQIQKTYPGIEVVLRIGNRDATNAALKAGAIDLAIMGRPPREPLVDADVLGPHPYIIVARPDHRLAGIQDVPPEELLKETFLTREEGSGTRILMTRFLDQIGNGQPYRRIEMGTNETIKQAVIAGLGIALISQHTVTAELESRRLVALRSKGLPILRQWFLIHPRAARLPPAAATIARHILSLDGSFLP